VLVPFVCICNSVFNFKERNLVITKKKNAAVIQQVQTRFE